MVGVGRRMNRLKAQLLNIRLGPGAALLPSDITRIHLHFSKKGDDGHFGAKNFFQRCLPRLKYWNPSVPMIVNRMPDADKSIMTIFLRRGHLETQAAAASAASQSLPSRTAPLITPNNQLSSSFQGNSPVPEPLSEERTVEIDMRRTKMSDILKALLEKTGAVPVVPTAQEEAELEEIRDRRVKSEADREVMAIKNTNKKREAAIMAQARKEAAAMKQAAL